MYLPLDKILERQGAQQTQDESRSALETLRNAATPDTPVTTSGRQSARGDRFSRGGN